MSSQKLYERLLVATVVITSVFVIPIRTDAVAMTSTNYQIQADVLSFGGSATSSSSNYSMYDAGGEFFAFTGTGSFYQERAGFIQAITGGSLALTLSGSSAALGQLSEAAVSSASVVATVTSTGSYGYSLRLREDGNLRATGGAEIDDVLDGAVTTGSEEYGVGTSGVDGLYNAADTNIDSAVLKTIASSASAAAGVTTTITFKASINGATGPGNYAQSVTVALVANF